MKYSVLLGSGILGLGSAFACAASAPLDYPETKKIDVVDVYHGVEVPDPYRWLEADVRESEEVAAWVEAQNEVTFGVLRQIPYRDAIRERLMEKLDYERYGSPFINAGRYYFTKNDGLQNHSVLYTTGESLDGEARVVIDPNTFSEDGTTALAGTFFSPDGRYMAYFVQEGGSDWRTGFVRDLETGKDLDDRLEWIKFSGASWKRDGSGFFYSRYPEPGEGEAFTGRNTNHMVYFHRIGTDQSEDVLVYENRDQPEYNFYSSATEDGRYLVIGVSKATSKNMILYKDLSEPLGYPVTLIGDFENDHSFVGNDGPIFYFVTNYEAPNGRLVAVDIRDPSKKNWETVIPETESVLTGVNFVGNQFVASYLEDASTRVRMYRPDGSFVRSVELPGIGTASGFGGERTDTTTFYSFSSYATPPSIYAYDLITGESTLFKRAGVDFNPDDYVVEQKFYTSKDGTRVPMFITRPKALRLDGQNPVLLYGYGGFDVSLTPSFSTTRAAWLEMGGVYVVANLRGGGEYGQGLVQGRHEAAEAERVRRFHRGGGVPDRQPIHLAGEAGDPGWIQRRAAGRGGDDAATGTLRGGLAGGGGAGHAAIPSVHDRPGVVQRLRAVREPGRVHGPVRVLAPAQYGAGHRVSGDAHHDCGLRRPRRSGPLVQVRRGVAGRPRPAKRKPGADPHRDRGWAWGGQADQQGDRGVRGCLLVRCAVPEHGPSREVPTPLIVRSVRPVRV